MRLSHALALSTSLAVASCAGEKAVAEPTPSSSAMAAGPTATVVRTAEAPVTQAQERTPAPIVELAPAPALTPPAAVPIFPPAGRSWDSVRSPAPGKAQALGEYSAGCVLGAEPLAREGDGYYVKRPQRLRHFGHPELIGFVRDLGAALHARELGGVVVGDLGQPRGGPAPDGHASHQSGLDVDIWFPLAQTARGIPKGAAARNALQAQAVANFPRRKLTEHWTPRVGQVLKVAASDPRVSRIFVNPVIKEALCKTETDRAWLRKIRPWWGHDAHFHVRLSCPADSAGCVPQSELPAGDGCAAVDWWFQPQSAGERDEERQKYRSRIGPGDRLPAQCGQVLSAPDVESATIVHTAK